MALTKIGATLGGSADVIQVTQSSHGLSLGYPVKVSGNGTYAHATADSATNAEAIGIIIATTTDTMTIALGGRITIDGVLPSGNLAAGTVLFLHTSAGKLTATEPSGNNEVSKPMAVITYLNSEMIMIQQRGEVINTAGGLYIPDDSIVEAKLDVSNGPTNGQFLQAQSGEGGGLTWAAAGGDLSFGGDTFGADKVIGSNDAYSLSFETAGVVTMPTQPAFYAINASTDDNQTGYNTEATIDFSDTETNCFDQGGDFASDTFTAPITGQYVFFAHMEIRGLSVAESLAQLRIKRNSGGTPYTQCDPKGAGYGGEMGMHLSSMMHLVAGDTVTVTLVGTYESSNIWDINGQTATHTTAFSGFLVA